MNDHAKIRLSNWDGRLSVEAIEFPTACEAIQHARASGQGAPISLRGKNLVVDQGEAERLEAARIEFAYLFEHTMPDGKIRILTVPVNG